MSLISILVLLLFVGLVGYGAYWIINRFFPAGLPRTIALAIVGILLLIVLLSNVGLLGGASALLATPVAA